MKEFLQTKSVPVTFAILRITSALFFLQAGGVKLFGWFGGMPGGVALSPLIMTAGILEVVGGGLLLLGLFTRPTAFILSGEMAFAYFLGHFPHGFWPAENNGAPAVLFCFIFLYIAAHGAGKYSLDGHLKHRKNKGSTIGTTQTT